MRHLSLVLKFLLSLAWFSSAYATDRNAATCSYADVNTAYGLAVDGDRVLIPAGSCDWTTNTLTVSKAIQVLGVSSTSPTIANAKFTVTVASGKAWRIGQMEITGTGGFNLTGFSKAWRIDHIKFTTVTGFTADRIIWINPGNTGYTVGVIDNVWFFHPQNLQIHIREEAGRGAYSWNRPLDLGGPDAIFIEDSTFEQDPTAYQTSWPATDCDGGGRLVFRYNTVKSDYFEMHDLIDTGYRSCRRWEAYNNNFYPVRYFTGSANPPDASLIGVRGGSGMVYNNTAFDYTGLGGRGVISIAVYRPDQDGGTPWFFCNNDGKKACLGASFVDPAVCTNDAGCGGITGSCLRVDSALASPSGYPCRDQTGWSGNASMFNRPALFWNNWFDITAPIFGGQTMTVNDNGRNTAYLQSGREYCVDDTTMPATCNGVTTRYTAYPYPHPLRTKAGPKPPTNGAVH